MRLNKAADKPFSHSSLELLWSHRF